MENLTEKHTDENDCAVSSKLIRELYELPLMDLIYRAHEVHRNHFDVKQIQISSLLSIKTGGCPENCSYCPQSAHHKTGVKKEKLFSVEETLVKAKAAKASGSTRFCMGAAWREVRDGEEFDRVIEMVQEVSALGLETCCTLGMLNLEQAKRLKAAGLYAYNHNIDTSRDFYGKIISTRQFDDRLKTIANVREAGITVCTGGIIGMGESDADRISFLCTLASLKPHPESVTINSLVPVAGTPLSDKEVVSPLVLVRVIAVARLLMPKSMIRLSAGRLSMSKESQLLSFYSGANSIFAGDKLLTSPNPSLNEDSQLFKEIGLNGAGGACH